LSSIGGHMQVWWPRGLVITLG